MKPCDPLPGVRCPDASREVEECDFLLEEKIPPWRKKDLIDGNDTTMIATAISVIESTTAYALVLADQGLVRSSGYVHIQTLVQA